VFLSDSPDQTDLEKICVEEWAKIPSVVCKPGEKLQETFDLCNCKQMILY